MASNDTGRIARVMYKGQTELDMACSDHTNQMNFLGMRRHITNHLVRVHPEMEAFTKKTITYL